MKVTFSYIANPSDKVFGFVMHSDTELPHIPVIRIENADRKALETLRNMLNEILEW